MKCFCMVLVLLFAGACGNKNYENHSREKSRQESLIKLVFRSEGAKKDFYVSGGNAQLLVFDLRGRALDAAQEKIKVWGYMKCCGTPLELSFDFVESYLKVDVKDFWTPGIYQIVIEVGEQGSKKWLKQAFDLEVH